MLGLVSLALLLYFQPNIIKYDLWDGIVGKIIPVKVKGLFYKHYVHPSEHLEHVFATQFFFYLFCSTLAYSMSFLPSGRYYQLVYGNFAMLLAFLYIFSYLGFTQIRTF